MRAIDLQAILAKRVQEHVLGGGDARDSIEKIWPDYEERLSGILQRLADESAFYLPNLSEAAPDQRRRLVRVAADEIMRLVWCAPNVPSD